MLNIILLVIGALVLIGGIGLAVNAISEDEKPKLYMKLMPVVGLCLIFFSFSFTIIPTGVVGVRYKAGIIDEKSVGSGIAFKVPLIEKIEHVDTRMQQQHFATKDYKINAESKEKALIDVSNVSITYSISSDKAAWFAANVVDYKQNIINVDVITTSIKGVLKQISTYDATTRTIVEPQVKERLQEVLNEKYGIGAVQVYEVILSDMSLEEKYKEAVTQKNMATQQQEQQAIENQTNIDRANAEAQAAKIAAEGRAEAEIAEAEGTAEANRLLTESLTPEVLEQRKIDAISNWRPLVIGEDSVPVIQVPTE